MNVAAWQKYVEASNAYIKKLERRLKQMNSQKQDFQRRIDHLQKNLKVADEVVDIVGYVVLIFSNPVVYIQSIPRLYILINLPKHNRYACFLSGKKHDMKKKKSTPQSRKSFVTIPQLQAVDSSLSANVRTV
jgi:hypothetical protein